MLEPHEILLSARLVHTGAPKGAPSANAVLIRDGIIVAVGDRANLARLAPNARAIDLPGAVLTPGLIDAHVHLSEWALTRSQTSLAGSTSPEHAVSMLRAGTIPEGGWIRGRGWSAHEWSGGTPQRSHLDAEFPDRPVVLQSHDMHSLWLNSVALRTAGIDASTPDPAGGRIVRDDAGVPTGLLLETAAQLALAHLPAPTFSDAYDAVVSAQSVLHTLGFTGVHSFPGIHIPEPDPFAVLQKMIVCDVMRLRVLQHIALEKLDAAIEVGLRSGFGNDWLRIGGVKLFLDGALGSRTAWMREPYVGYDSVGVNVLDRAELASIVVKAAAAGIACTVHAIGDAAVSLALDELSHADRVVDALPHRIEHVQCCPRERMADFRRFNIVASMQPCHLMSDWQAADRNWGARGRDTYALRSLLGAGATLAFGSDAPVESIDPRRSLFAAVARQDEDHQPADGWYAEERITAQEALTGFTAGPAFAAGTGNRQGILTEGAWADIAAWNADPLAVDARELLDIRCIATMVAGEMVYS